MGRLASVWAEEQGQDLWEYALLMAFVVVAAGAIFLVCGQSFAGIWNVTNSQVVAASSQVIQ
jgi:Flp pilus assembly pilin Flp